MSRILSLTGPKLHEPQEKHFFDDSRHCPHIRFWHETHCLGETGGWRQETHLIVSYRWWAISSSVSRGPSNFGSVGLFTSIWAVCFGAFFFEPARDAGKVVLAAVDMLAGWIYEFGEIASTIFVSVESRTITVSLSWPESSLFWAPAGDWGWEMVPGSAFTSGISGLIGLN